MFDRLDDILIHYEELMLELNNPSVAEDQNRFRKLMKEQADLAPLVDTYKEYKQAKQDEQDSLALLEEEKDEEMRELAKEELSDASFWKTSTDAEMYVSDMYNSLGWSADDAINTDDATMGIKWAATNESKGVYDPSDYAWKSSYKYIREANLALEKLPTVEMDEATRQKLAGQAYFFRGYLYWDLIRSFGSVPYIDKPLTLADLNNTVQSTREEV